MSALEGARELLGDRLGFRFDRSMRRRLARGVEDGAQALGTTEARYVEILREDPERLQELIDRVAVSETYFFREPQHFEALARHVLPLLGDEVSVWCAACSNGQEPYSLAMVLAEANISSWRILATDVVTTALERTAAGTYAERDLRGLSEERRRRHLVRDGDRGFAVSPALRERVTVGRHNLVCDPAPEGAAAFDVVFCRNVLIYMRPRQTEAVLATVHAAMKPDAHLFIGASESLWHLNTGVATVRLDDTYAYTRGGVAARPKAPATPPRRPSPAPPPARSPRPQRAARPPAPLSDIDELLARGDAAFARDDVPSAIAAYREAREVAPSTALPHALLGLALEQSGEDEAARHAFEEAWEVLGQGDPREAERVLDGYRAEELARLLIGKLRSTA